MAHNIVLLRDLPREHQFSLYFNQETNVTIVGMGTSTKPPFSRLDVWRPHELQREPESYDIKVNPNGAIVSGGKFCPISLTCLILRKTTPCELQWPFECSYCDFFDRPGVSAFLLQRDDIPWLPEL